MGQGKGRGELADSSKAGKFQLGVLLPNEVRRELEEASQAAGESPAAWVRLVVLAALGRGDLARQLSRARAKARQLATDGGGGE